MTSTTNNILNTLGLCKASGNLVHGEKLINAIRANKAHLVIMSLDVAKNNEKKITDKTKFYEIKLIRMFSKEELSKSVGMHNIVAVGVLDKNLAQKLIKITED